MSNFSKPPGPTKEDLLCGICYSEDDEKTIATLRNKKRERNRHHKFDSENLNKKQKDSQSTLTNLAFRPCCTKKCLLNTFGKKDDPNFFDFVEAKKCFEHYYTIYKSKSKDEYDLWLYDEFQKTCYGLDESEKIIHQYTLSYGPSYAQKTFVVCKEVWAYFFNTSEYRIKRLSDAYKTNKSAIGSRINKNTLYSDSTNHNTTVEELKSMYEELGLEYNLEMLQMGAIQRHEFDTFFWFRDHFELIGDPMPNTAGEVHIDKVEKQEIYCLYVNEVRHNCLTFPAWCKFWKRCFSNVKIRKWKNVSGKCDDCAAINNGRLSAQSLDEAKAFRKLHLLHKSGLFMQERYSYHRRRSEARANPESILSVIIDTMDNNHCSIPYLGVNDTFGSPIHQGILGCFAHNTGNFNIYRTTGAIIIFLMFLSESLNI